MIYLTQFRGLVWVRFLGFVDYKYNNVELRQTCEFRMVKIESASNWAPYKFSLKNTKLEKKVGSIFPF